ncbi:MAG: carboxypeptidase-like regulatory domain-containing protein [Bacteroidales bacterium]|nr:carboxypeptidase-like regulatory domain-containing protein [Bacteroidales bacterium]
MKEKLTITVLLILCLSFANTVHGKGHRKSVLWGIVTSTGPDQTPIDYATLVLKGTDIGTATDEEGKYEMIVPPGKHTLVVSAIGYETAELEIEVCRHEKIHQDIKLKEASVELSEVIVTASGVSRINQSAYNVIAIDATDLHNSTKNLGEALTKMPGMKLRETGGVGSDMQIMLDGFSGRHVKVFVDGVPQEGAGTAFDLNNVPVNFADRIEVYKGVVPVGFGSDAIGGVINIVTDKSRRRWFLDASYSYGSFNTHRSYVNLGQTFNSGFSYEINAFQNYSDNDYHIDNWVEVFNHENNTSIQDENKTLRVRRFNDTFHNEAVTGKAGFIGRSWTDRLMFGFTWSHFYKEIQTGVYQRIVFGEKHRHGHSLSPSVEYQKRNLLIEGLDVVFSANYNRNLTTNVDTAMWRYNWLGDRLPRPTPGEQGHIFNEQKDKNWNAAFTASYRLGSKHLFMLNHVFSSFDRTGRSLIPTNSRLENFDVPTITRKNITGLSYRMRPSDWGNFSVFGKHYASHNEGAVQLTDNSTTDFVNKSTSAFGYGAAGTCFLPFDMQVKLSYEKALRLPSARELFGDGDLEAGKANLRPERSHNLNLNISYNRQWDQNGLYVDGSLIYRNTSDYIVRAFSSVGGSSYGFYENHGRVVTKGFNISLRYNYGSWINAGGTFNKLDARDMESKRTSTSGQKSLTYKQRIPNQPYMFANFDINFHWHDLFRKGNVLKVGWDSFWQHEFPLHWEGLGDASTKIRVPEQFSHNLLVGYSLLHGRYNFSVECRNLTDAKLYDNYSLQKAGRAFYVKVRVSFGG